ncbi:MAG: MerR family transcriptional regulator [Nitrososphaerota archaeon]
MQAPSQPHHRANSVPHESGLNIGIVSQITGLSEATLRMWERRYHFPHTARSTGGHRIYAQQSVIQLQWVTMRMDEGMRVHRALQALQQWAHESAQEDAVERAMTAAFAAPVPPAKVPNHDLVSAQHSLMDALLSYDSVRATMVLTAATARHPLDRVVLAVIGPALAEIGDRWRAGELEVATEHFASNLLRHQLLEWVRTSPPPFQVRPIVLACAPDELHEGSLLMLAVLLRRLRWPVLYLGQSLPLSDLAALVERVEPALVVFVAMSDFTTFGLAEWPLWLVRDGATRLPIIGYGGRPFTENPALADVVPGVLLGTTIHEGTQHIHRLMLNLNVAGV